MAGVEKLLSLYLWLNIASKRLSPKILHFLALCHGFPGVQGAHAQGAQSAHDVLGGQVVHAAFHFSPESMFQEDIAWHSERLLYIRGPLPHSRLLVLLVLPMVPSLNPSIHLCTLSPLAHLWVVSPFYLLSLPSPPPRPRLPPSMTLPSTLKL